MAFSTRTHRNKTESFDCVVFRGNFMPSISWALFLQKVWHTHLALPLTTLSDSATGHGHMHRHVTRSKRPPQEP